MEKSADREAPTFAWHTSPPHREPVVDRAREILAFVDDVHRRMDFRYPPFRFEDFFRVFDEYRVFEVDMPQELDGSVVLASDGERPTIRLRRDNSRARIRFTLAHEIMHARLHRDGCLTGCRMECRTGAAARETARDVVEREADFGAAALLMPLWMIDRCVPYRSSADYPDQVVARLARVFRVSEGAMRLQLAAYAAALRGGPEAADDARETPPQGLGWLSPAWSGPLPARRPAPAAGR